MTKFFKPEDFALPSNELGSLHHSIFSMAETANKKLEANRIEITFCADGGIFDPKLGRTPMKRIYEHKAYYVRIDECEHPTEKVRRKPYEPGYLGLYDYICACGEVVHPASFATGPKPE